MESSPLDHQGSAPDIQLDVNQWAGHWASPNTHTHTHTHTHSIPPTHPQGWGMPLRGERGQKEQRSFCDSNTPAEHLIGAPSLLIPILPMGTLRLGEVR